MKRRILSLLLVLALTVGLLPTVQAADSFQLTYTAISSPAGLEITGYTGAIPKKLTIPATIGGRPVVSIGENAFASASMEELVLPDSVKKIGKAAFRDCVSLRSATLASVEMIGVLGFYGCTALTHITLPDTLTEMGGSCFEQTGLTEITIPGSLKIVPSWCFSASQLRTVTISEGVEQIDGYAFFYSHLEGCLTLPKSLTSIGYLAFDGNENLHEIRCLADSMKSPPDIPETCTVFCHAQERPSYLNSWERFVLFEELPYDCTGDIITEGPVSYVLCDGVACVTRCTATGDYTLPDTLGGCPVGVIGPFAFSDATLLSRITLPDSITYIGRGAFCGTLPVVTRLPKHLTTLGEAAFYNPSYTKPGRLTFRDGTIPEGITEIPDNAFSFTEFPSLTFPAELKTIGSGAFYAVGADSITFTGNSLREIKPAAFYGMRTETIELPEGVEIIGDSSFRNWGSIKQLFLPRSLKECKDMFGSQSSAETVVYGYSDTPAYAYCTDNEITFVDRETGEVSRKPYITTQGGVQYYVKPGQYAEIRDTVLNCPRDLVIPETVDGVPVTAVSDWAFSTRELNSVYLPDTVTTLYDMAFIDCTGLKSLRLSENLEFIGGYCFCNCPNLKYLYIPASVTTMSPSEPPIDSTTVALCEEGSYAQEYFPAHRCRSITLTPGKEYVWEDDALCRVEGEGAALLALKAISEGSKEYFEVPDSVAGHPVTSIDTDAVFYDRWAHTLYLGRNVESIGEGALKDTEIFTLYTYPALTNLPENLFPGYNDIPPEIYGFSDTYAEAYCAAHSIRFHAIDTVPFTDVPEDSWYYPWVFTCYWAGYMNGTSATKFSPNGVTSRAMLVTVLYRMCGEYTSVEVPFNDVDYVGYYYDAVRWAQTYGVVYGTSATTFSPNRPVTREQTATILYRLGSILGGDVDSYTPLTRFRDEATASDYARSALMWAVDAGILQGNDRSELNPGGNTTRAQMAAILMRFVQWLETEGLR